MSDADPAPEVDVRYTDLPLARIAAHEALAVAGVVRLQHRPRTMVTRRVSGDVSAIEISRAPDGSMDVALGVVVRLEPPPVRTMQVVADTVSAHLRDVTGVTVRTQVTVTDVEP